MCNKLDKGGSLHWYIPDGFIPSKSQGELISHEAICILNTSEEDAKLQITIYFEDNEPIVGIEETVPKQRTRHIKTDTLQVDGNFIPKGIPYALQITGNTPITVQYSRMDATQPANALMTSIAYSSN